MKGVRPGTPKLAYIIIYRITGRQLFFRIPEKVCTECDLSVAIVRRVVADLGAEKQVRVTVKPWVNSLIGCLFWRSWHPPIVTVNGKRFSQGVVPDKLELTNILKQSLEGDNDHE